MSKFLASILAFSALAFAGTTGIIAGTVRDRDMDEIPLSGATVLLLGTDHEVQTDDNGEYIIHNLNPGEYWIQVEMTGKKEQSMEGVMVFADMTTRMDFKLYATSEASTVITLSDHKASVVSRETASVTVMNSRDINDMHVNSLEELVSLTAGAVLAESDIHIRGGRAGEVVYLLDGIPVSDPATNRFPLNIPLSAVSEVSVTTGGFSAEYGEAQSAVVNIITRNTAERFTGSFSGGAGAYSTLSDRCSETPEISGWQNQEYHGDAYAGEGSIGGQLGLPGRSSFFITGGYNRSGFNHMDSRGNWDNSNCESYSSTARLSWRPSSSTQLVTSFYLSNAEKGLRDWLWSRIGEHYVNDGDTLYYARENNRALPAEEQSMFSPGLAVTQTINDRSYLELRLNFAHLEKSQGVTDSTGNTIGDGFTVDDWLEYLAPERFQDRDNFYRSGHVNWVGHESESNTVTARVDYTNQINGSHQLKTGYQGRFFQVEGWDVIAPPENPSTYSSWEGSPVFHGLYIQDRIEYPNGLTVNLGLRLDAADPGTDSTETISKISPRLGVSYALSASDVIRANYGSYCQPPGLQQMYLSSQSGSSASGELLSGNPGLEYEETVAWELGYRHLFNSYTMLDAVAYNKTSGNLVSTSPDEDTGELWQYVNSDENGKIWGVEVGLLRRSSRFFSYSLNYSYSVARGTESSSLENYSYNLNGQYPPTDDEVYLNWDQRHTATASAGLTVERGDRLLGQSWLEGFGVRLNTSYGSGMPYDNANHGVYPLERNQSRYPWRMNTDLRVEKTFWTGRNSFNVHVDVYNLFGRRNVETICDVDLWETEHQAGGSEADPNAYSPARHIFIGGEFSW